MTISNSIGYKDIYLASIKLFFVFTENKAFQCKTVKTPFVVTSLLGHIGVYTFYTSIIVVPLYQILHFVLRI